MSEREIYEQVLNECLYADRELAGRSPAVSIYGSARLRADRPEYALAERLARRFAEGGFTVLSGGGPGLMEAANKGAFETGRGASVGLNIVLPREQTPNPYQDVALKFNHFASRKAAFVRHALAYVVLPGGFGTLDELFETLTLIQTGKIPRRPLILMDSSFWRGLLDWLEGQVLGRGMIAAADLAHLPICDDVEEVWERVQAYYAQIQ